MRTLLTGAKGQLARCLRDRLPEDWELIATDSTSLDITDTEAVHHMIKNFQPDAIVNAAAYTAVDKAEENAEAALPQRKRCSQLSRSRPRRACPLYPYFHRLCIRRRRQTPLPRNRLHQSAQHLRSIQSRRRAFGFSRAS